MKKAMILLVIFAAAAFLPPAAAGQPGQALSPEKREWFGNLGKALTLEKLAQEQYASDSERFNISMPYRTILPQVEDHIQALTDLFNIYGVAPDAEPKPVSLTRSINESYRAGIKIERDLITLYEWLARNAEDRNAAATLNDLLAQARRHLTLFEYGLNAGQRMGRELGPPGRGGWR